MVLEILIYLLATAAVVLLGRLTDGVLARAAETQMVEAESRIDDPLAG